MNGRYSINGWWVFAGVLLLITGTLNMIYGFAAIGNSRVFSQDTVYVLVNLRVWGWIAIVIGLCEWVAAFSLWSGGEFGRGFGIAVASINAVAALLEIPSYPFWSLAIFALCILIIYKLAEGPAIVAS